MYDYLQPPATKPSVIARSVVNNSINTKNQFSPYMKNVLSSLPIKHKDDFYNYVRTYKDTFDTTTTTLHPNVVFSNTSYSPKPMTNPTFLNTNAVVAYLPSTIRDPSNNTINVINTTNNTPYYAITEKNYDGTTQISITANNNTADVIIDTSGNIIFNGMYYETNQAINTGNGILIPVANGCLVYVTYAVTPGPIPGPPKVTISRLLVNLYKYNNKKHKKHKSNKLYKTYKQQYRLTDIRQNVIDKEMITIIKEELYPAKLNKNTLMKKFD
jgi:hypothetical protein